MKFEKRMILSIVWLLLGLALFCLGFAEVVDEYWSGMGSGFIAVGILQLVRFYRVQKDSDYREKIEVEKNDERSRFIRSKAWSWTGYIFLLTAAVLTIALRVIGQELLSLAAGYAVCFMLIVYWITFLVLKKKY